jgi:hypothetical protein
MSSQHHLLLLLFALIHLSLSQVYFDTVFPCVLRGAIASCAQCDFANPQTAWVGACARCRGNNDDEICVSGCPSNRLLSKCDDDDEPTPSPTPPRPTPRPSPLPTPMPVPTTTQQVIVYTQSPTPPPTPYPTEPSAVPTASTTMYKSTSESTSFVDTTIDGSTTVSIFTIMLSSVPATASSETSAAESPVPFFTDNNAQSTMAPLSLDAWVGIGCAAVILCSCCLTFCVVCAVRRKRRRDAERNDALAYYQNAARPAPPTMSVFNTASVPFATTQPHLQQPQQQTGIVCQTRAHGAATVGVAMV